MPISPQLQKNEVQGTGLDSYTLLEQALQDILVQLLGLVHLGNLGENLLLGKAGDYLIKQIGS